MPTGVLSGLSTPRRFVTPPEDAVHIPILVDVVLDFLAARPGGVYIDATANGGGHTGALLEASAPNGRVLAFDRDPDLIDQLRSKRADAVQTNRLSTAGVSFSEMEETVAEQGFPPADGILFDLGLSSYHLDRSGRGFAFAHDEPLDMRFGGSEIDTRSARDIIMRAPVNELTTILRELGEERYASRIARTIIADRKKSPFETTTDLFQAIERSLPANTRWRAGRHAARVFQGLRIAVNDELDTIHQTLPQAWKCLAPGGRMVVLSFHSLEDRIIKRWFRDRAREDDARILTKKPLVAGEAEIASNSRAASAKVRAIEKSAKT